jgi:hypothetical protein
VSGYSVAAVAKTATDGERVQIGTRTAATAKKTTIKGLAANEAYDVEVRSLAGPRMSEAFTVDVGAPGPPPEPGMDTRPTLGASPDRTDNGVTTASSVTLTSNGQIFYTTDGKPAITGDMPSDEATLYTGPIPISAPTTLNVAAFDTAGNHREFMGDYQPPEGPKTKPDAPTGLSGTAGQQSVALKWASTDTSITGYGVQVYDGPGNDAQKVGDLRETTAKTLTVSLTANQEYWFTVQAKNANGYGAESTKAGPYVPTADRITIGSARWKSGDFRVTGTGSVVGTAADPVSVTVHPAKTDGTIDTSRSLGTAPVTAAAAPATGGEYSLRARNAAAGARNPGKVYVKSSKGGVAGPFTVANG